MPRYRVEPHDEKGPYSEEPGGDGPLLESIETTCAEDGEILFYSGYSAREMAQRRQREAGGQIYVNSVSRQIIRKDFNLATNAPVYFAVATSPVYTLIRKDDAVVRAYWPPLDD